jgi:chromosome segregation ATPase
MKNNRITRSSNIGNPRALSNSNRATNLSANLPKKERYPPLTQKSKEDDYISSLQKQVYYLELEMKLMKDRELDTKNKVGGYEVLFRDGVPLNENFLALKTKYKNERDAFEKIILDLNTNIDNTNKENINLTNQIEQTNKSYFDLLQRLAQTETDLNQAIFDTKQKLYTTENSLVHLKDDNNTLNKSLYRFEQENIQHNRIIEKNNMFYEDPTEKNEKTKKDADEKWSDVNRVTEKTLLELDSLEKKYAGNRKLKMIEQENLDLLQQITKLQQSCNSAQTKINELTNAQNINKKFLFEEERERDKYLEENNRLNDEMDNLSKMNDERMKEAIKDYEDKQKVILKNQSNNAEKKMELLLTKYKDAEANARSLLEQKNKLLQDLALLDANIKEFNIQDTEVKNEIVETKTNINQTDDFLNSNKDILIELIQENERLRNENDELEQNIKKTRIDIEEIQQKIELNAMLKDIDVNELKVLSQNNAIVNNNINNLLTKWDKVHSKLVDIEKKQQNNK